MTKSSPKRIPLKIVSLAAGLFVFCNNPSQALRTECTGWMSNAATVMCPEGTVCKSDANTGVCIDPAASPPTRGGRSKGNASRPGTPANPPAPNAGDLLSYEGEDGKALKSFSRQAKTDGYIGYKVAVDGIVGNDGERLRQLSCADHSFLKKLKDWLIKKDRKMLVVRMRIDDLPPVPILIISDGIVENGVETCKSTVITHGVLYAPVRSTNTTGNVSISYDYAIGESVDFTFFSQVTKLASLVFSFVGVGDVATKFLATFTTDAARLKIGEFEKTINEKFSTSFRDEVRDSYNLNSHRGKRITIRDEENVVLLKATIEHEPHLSVFVPSSFGDPSVKQQTGDGYQSWQLTIPPGPTGKRPSSDFVDARLITAIEAGTGIVQLQSIRYAIENLPRLGVLKSTIQLFRASDSEKFYANCTAVRNLLSDVELVTADKDIYMHYLFTAWPTAKLRALLIETGAGCDGVFQMLQRMRQLGLDEVWGETPGAVSPSAAVSIPEVIKKLLPGLMQSWTRDTADERKGGLGAILHKDVVVLDRQKVVGTQDVQDGRDVVALSLSAVRVLGSAGYGCYDTDKADRLRGVLLAVFAGGNGQAATRVWVNFKAHEDLKSITKLVIWRMDPINEKEPLSGVTPEAIVRRVAYSENGQLTASDNCTDVLETRFPDVWSKVRKPKQIAQAGNSN